MVPPTIEALMDIMEGSKDLTELLGNEVAPDVVDQTRDLVQQVIKKVSTRACYSLKSEMNFVKTSRRLKVVGPTM